MSPGEARQRGHHHCCEMCAQTIRTAKYLGVDVVKTADGHVAIPGGVAS